MIPLSVPHIAGNEWKYIKECLDTGWVSSVGKQVDRFEIELSRRVNCDYGVATTNGTSALHTALLVAGVRPDDEVLVSSFTFMAAVNAIHYCGGKPVLVDAEADFWQMDPALVVDFLHNECEIKSGETYNRSSGRRVKAILPVHLYGHPVDMELISECAQEFGLAVVEDACESLGATYKGKPVGSLGNMACFSFNGNKIITTGGGGMITTNNEEFAVRAKFLTNQAKDDPIEYMHNEVGYNYRMNNIEAALGVAQLEQLDSFIHRKKEIIANYRKALQGIKGINLFEHAEWAECTYWLANVLVDEIEFGGTARELMSHLQNNGIQSRPLWRPIHLQAPYISAQRLGGSVSEKLYQEGLSLPGSVGLQDSEIISVTNAIRKFA
jgi:perosamine synthetase